jgi:hypothetical protein
LRDGSHTADVGGGIDNAGTLIMTNSMVGGNEAIHWLAVSDMTVRAGVAVVSSDPILIHSLPLDFLGRHPKIGHAGHIAQPTSQRVLAHIGIVSL